MAEDSMGNILPTDLERLTLDQALILLLPKGSFGETSFASPSDAAKAGVIPREKIKPKSKAAMVAEKIQARKMAEKRKRRRQRR